MRPSPARVEAPEPDVWIPILDVATLEALQTHIDPVLARELDELEYRFLEPLPGTGRGDGAEARDATARVVPVLPAVVLPRTPEVEVPAVPGLELPPEPEPEVLSVIDPAHETPAHETPAHETPAHETVALAAAHRHRRLHRVLLAVALAAVAAGIPYFLRAPARLRVTLDVEGASFTQTTRAPTVAALLAGAGITLAPGDTVSPAPSATLANDTTVQVVRAFPVTVDVDGRTRVVHTTAANLATLRRRLRIPAAMVALGASTRVERGSTIVFRTPHDLTLIVDGVAGSLTSTARTVGELLTERAVAVAPGDQIDPAPATAITGAMKVSVTHTTADRVTEDTPVPFPTGAQVDPSLPAGQRKVVQAGSPGIDRTTYQLTKVGQAVVGKQAMGTVRVQDPTPEIVAVGTKPAGGTGNQSGSATWYSTLNQPGTCAHLQLPFGTIVTVIDTASGGSTTCRVADRGPEAWTGNIIDLSPDVFRRLSPLSSGVIAVRLEY